MNKIITTLFLLLFASSVFAAKLYTGGEKYEKDGVIALTLTLNGKLIEWVYKENISQCLKSKRVASREVGGERVEKSASVSLRKPSQSASLRFEKDLEVRELEG